MVIYLKMKSNPEYKNELIEKIKSRETDYQKKTDKEFVNFTVYLISQYELHSHFDLLKICMSLHDLCLIDAILALIGKKSPIELNERVEMQKSFIKKVLGTDIGKTHKAAETYCDKFNIPIEEYP